MGPTGPTGSTGSTGPVGVDGSIGIGIISAATGASGGPAGSVGNNWITFYLTDGTTIGVSGARGNTGASDSQDFQIINAIEGPDYGQIYHSKNGITAYFKSLTVSGKDISIGVTSDYTIILEGATYDIGRLGNTGELLYNFSGASAHGALNTFWSGDQLTARILTHRESKDGNNIVIGTRVNVRGPVPENTEPIAGTADVDGTVVSFTYITQHQETDKDSIEKGMVSGFHLGKTGDENVIHEFTGLTYDNLIQGDLDVGSCCFCEKSEGPDRSGCTDYVSRTYCESINGSFSSTSCLKRPEGPDCYPQGACCLLGGCIETSEENCETYGGFFVDGETCQGVETLGGCPDTCSSDVGSCCINQVCFELTEYQCSFEPNSVWIDAPCENTNCCLEASNGACCLDEKCYNTNALLCSAMESSNGTPGIFWGVGSKCAGPFEESRYYPHDCTDEEGNIVGRLENGRCADSSYPPCTAECVGWTQEIDNRCADEDGFVVNICACNGVECPCDKGDGQYGCNVCGSNTQACSTIITTDGNCWECCCETDPEPPPAVQGACCLGGSCAYLTLEECNDIGGYLIEGIDCSAEPCTVPVGACCYGTIDECEVIDYQTCTSNGGEWHLNQSCLDACSPPPDTDCPICCVTSCMTDGGVQKRCDSQSGEYPAQQSRNQYCLGYDKNTDNFVGGRCVDNDIYIDRYASEATSPFLNAESCADIGGVCRKVRVNPSENWEDDPELYTSCGDLSVAYPDRCDCFSPMEGDEQDGIPSPGYHCPPASSTSSIGTCCTTYCYTDEPGQPGGGGCGDSGNCFATLRDTCAEGPEACLACEKQYICDVGLPDGEGGYTTYDCECLATADWTEGNLNCENLNNGGVNYSVCPASFGEGWYDVCSWTTDKAKLGEFVPGGAGAWEDWVNEHGTDGVSESGWGCYSFAGGGIARNCTKKYLTQFELDSDWPSGQKIEGTESISTLGGCGVNLAGHPFRPEVIGGLCKAPDVETEGGLFGHSGLCCNVFADLDGLGTRFHKSLCLTEYACNLLNESASESDKSWKGIWKGHEVGEGEFFVNTCYSTWAESQCPAADVIGACCNADGTCQQLSEVACLSGALHYPEQSCADACGDVELGICCGGAYSNNIPRPCNTGSSLITYEACQALATEDYPVEWKTDPGHDCCGSCCWWGGEPEIFGGDGEQYNCIEIYDKLFYECEDLINLNGDGDAPCYASGDYQDVSWVASCDEVSSCPNEKIGCCHNTFESSRCYCIEQSGFADWVEGPCTPTDPVGACCDISNEQCHEDKTETWCVTSCINCHWLGENSSCGGTPNPCLSRCCDPSDPSYCEEFWDQSECGLNDDGEWKIPGEYGTDCATSSCAEFITGACCSTDFTCYIDTQSVCEDSGHVYQGDGTICAGDDSCGSCCVDGECLDFYTQENCFSNTDWQTFEPAMHCCPYGDGSNCHSCPESYGACCSPIAGCLEVWESDCSLGLFCGDDTTCPQNGGEGCGDCASGAAGACCYFTQTIQRCEYPTTASECSDICNSSQNWGCIHYAGDTCQSAPCGGGGGGGGSG